MKTVSEKDKWRGQFRTFEFALLISSDICGHSYYRYADIFDPVGFESIRRYWSQRFCPKCLEEVHDPDFMSKVVATMESLEYSELPELKGNYEAVIDRAVLCRQAIVRFLKFNKALYLSKAHIVPAVMQQPLSIRAAKNLSAVLESIYQYYVKETKAAKWIAWHQEFYNESRHIFQLHRGFTLWDGPFKRFLQEMICPTEALCEGLETLWGVLNGSPNAEHNRYTYCLVYGKHFNVLLKNERITILQFYDNPYVIMLPTEKFHHHLWGDDKEFRSSYFLPKYAWTMYIGHISTSLEDPCFSKQHKDILAKATELFMCYNAGLLDSTD